MKIFLVGIGAIFLFSQQSFAQDSKIDCTVWGEWTNEQKTMYLAGYSDAVAILGIAGAIGGKSPDEVVKIVGSMWPQGYNLGKLGDELDKICGAKPFDKMRVNFAIAGLAAKVQKAK